MTNEKKAMQKRFILLSFLILFFIVLLNNVSAALCYVETDEATCTINEYYKVMGLSYYTNAHGELASQNNYDYVLCCDFGDGVQENECTGTNKIIGLSSATNAHAEEPYPLSPQYTGNDVCYEDLDCSIYDTTGSDCNTASGENYPIDILSLSSLTNAHIFQIDVYPTNTICCNGISSIALSCDLTDAYWSLDGGETHLASGDNPRPDGALVDLIVEGTNCWGTTIEFKIYEEESGDDTLVTTKTAPFDSTTWNAVAVDDNPSLPGYQQPDYYFKATVQDTSESVSLLDLLDDNHILLKVGDESVLTWCEENKISSCESYTTLDDCKADDCEKSSNVIVPDGDCSDTDINCFCNWTGTSCEGTYENLDVPEVGECETGYTLCHNDDTGLDYCYLGNDCPPGEEPPNDNDGICELGEGCSSADCKDGDTDSCAGGAVCQNNVCFKEGSLPVDVDGCISGYTLCHNDTADLNFCYPGSKCPTGEEPECDNDGICELGEGCGSADCKDRDIDSCLLGAYCFSGKCYSPILSSIGKCSQTGTTTGNCDTDQFITYDWDGTWTWSAECNAACQVKNADKKTICEAGGLDSYECPAQAQLPFFNIFTLIATVIVIASVYAYMILIKKGRFKK